MGYIRHHAIAVTSWNDELIKKAHEKAMQIFKDRTSSIIESDVNSYQSFFIAPDGSKEGWGESDIGDVQRKTFKDWINEQAYEDGSNSLSFCEFFYGDDNGESLIEAHNQCLQLTNSGMKKRQRPEGFFIQRVIHWHGLLTTKDD